MDRSNIQVSVVIPVYRSARGLSELSRRVVAQLENMNIAWELILVDDGSPDNAYEEIEGICSENPNVKGILLAQNRGQHYATLCGIKNAMGNYIVTMDDDLQNSPDEIPKLIAAIDSGFHIVIGAPEMVKQNSFRRLSSSLMQFMLEKLLNKPRGLRLTSFRCLSRKAADLIAEYEGIFPYMPALMFNAIPFRKITNVSVRHYTRKIGSSSYSFKQLLGLASYLLINHSKFLLRAVVITGLVLALIAIGMTLFFVVRYLVLRSSPVGWTSLAVLTTFFSGMLLVSLGIIGEYIGRIIDQSDRTSRYQVYKKFNG